MFLHVLYLLLDFEWPKIYKAASQDVLYSTFFQMSQCLFYFMT